MTKLLFDFIYSYFVNVSIFDLMDMFILMNISFLLFYKILQIFIKKSIEEKENSKNENATD